MKITFNLLKDKNQLVIVLKIIVLNLRTNALVSYLEFSTARR